MFSRKAWLSTHLNEGSGLECLYVISSHQDYDVFRKPTVDAADCEYLESSAVCLREGNFWCSLFILKLFTRRLFNSHQRSSFSNRMRFNAKNTLNLNLKTRKFLVVKGEYLQEPDTHHRAVSLLSVITSAQCLINNTWDSWNPVPVLPPCQASYVAPEAHECRQVLGSALVQGWAPCRSLAWSPAGHCVWTRAQLSPERSWLIRSQVDLSKRASSHLALEYVSCDHLWSHFPALYTSKHRHCFHLQKPMLCFNSRVYSRLFSNHANTHDTYYLLSIL